MRSLPRLVVLGDGEIGGCEVEPGDEVLLADATRAGVRVVFLPDCGFLLRPADTSPLSDAGVAAAASPPAGRRVVGLRIVRAV